VKPTRSINFITLRFTATRTGASFAEIVGWLSGEDNLPFPHFVMTFN
jgi:hypothetical protein